MKLSVRRFTLDVQKIDSGKLLEVKRGNTAVQLCMSLTDGGIPYRISEGLTAVFTARKPDGAALFNDCTIKDNDILYDFTGQTVNVTGIVSAEIRLYSGDNLVLTTERFELAVDDTVYPDGAIPDSSDEYTALTQMVSRGTDLMNDLTGLKTELEPIRDDALEAAEKASLSALTAKGHSNVAERAALDAEAAAARAEAAAGGGGGSGSVSATVEIIDGIEVVTATAGSVTVTVVDGIEVVG